MFVSFFRKRRHKIAVSAFFDVDDISSMTMFRTGMALSMRLMLADYFFPSTFPFLLSATPFKMRRFVFCIVILMTEIILSIFGFGFDSGLFFSCFSFGIYPRFSIQIYGLKSYIYRSIISPTGDLLFLGYALVFNLNLVVSTGLNFLISMWMIFQILEYVKKLFISFICDFGQAHFNTLSWNSLLGYV